MRPYLIRTVYRDCAAFGRSRSAGRTYAAAAAMSGRASAAGRPTYRPRAVSWAAAGWRYRSYSNY